MKKANIDADVAECLEKLKAQSEPWTQATGDTGLANTVLKTAEGTGLEPATPYGAPHFQCGR